MIDINEKLIYEDLKSKIQRIRNNIFIKEILIKDIFINSESDLLEGIKKCIHDKYSDIDITLNIKDNNCIQLKDIGIVNEEILGIKLEVTESNCVIRMIQKNGIRYDIILFGADNQKIENEINVIEKADMFVAILALGKLMRKDYLISAHLAHMLCMESLVDQMKARDVEYNTNFHRYGYREDLNYFNTYKKLENKYCDSDDIVYNHISKLLISGVENIKEISDADKKKFYEIWDFYLK